MTLTASLVLAFTAAFGINQAQVITISAPMPEAQTVEQYVRSYFADVPVLADIAQCESQMHQFDKNGNVIRNPGSSAVGIMQIMSSIHDPVADKLGLDIYTIQGNLAYARYLYDHKGTLPWDASKSCWGKSKNNKDALAVATK
jgi:hypothetical protein